MPRKSFTPDDPALPMNYPGFVFRQLCDEGFSAQAMLANTGLKDSQLSDPNFHCGFWPLRRLYMNAIEQTGDPHLGVRMALSFQPNYIGLPAYTAMNAELFKNGLEVLERFFFLSFPAFELKILDNHASLQAGEAAIRLRPKFPFIGIEYFAFSSAIVAINGLLKAMLQSKTAADRAEMTISVPENWSPNECPMGFPVRFDAPECQLIFSESLFDRPLPAADRFNHLKLVSLCEQFAAEAAFQTTPVTQVIALLERTPSLNLVLSNIAAELGYSERSLRRQLDRSNTSYQKLLDQVREQRARNLLSGSTLPIKAIAAAVGFESSSNFARSFKRWTGFTPKSFRNMAHGLNRGDIGQK